MEFSPTKCEHIKFSRKRTNTDDNRYSLHGIDIPKANNIKYLGVKLDPALTWNQNTDYIASKASYKIGFIRRIILVPYHTFGTRHTKYWPDRC